MKKLPIGISDFRELREGNFFFADKSLLIKDIINDDSKIILLPRPRRFGKTLNLSMLKYFFEKNDSKHETRQFFSELSIEKEHLFQLHFARYPVIYLTLKNIKYSNFTNDLEPIELLIANEFERHDYLLKSDALTQVQKKRFEDIIHLNAKRPVLEASLFDLSHYLYTYHKKRAIVLIDEYDTPIQSAFIEGYYKETIRFFRIFLGSVLKDNPNIYKGVLSGILRVARESIFSDMNNIGVYSILREEYSPFFGFTENDIKLLISDYEITKSLEEIKKWYDGYTFGKQLIYNPWSILNFISSKDQKFRPYWANTSSNILIQELFAGSRSSLKGELYDLLKDTPVHKQIEENISFETIKTNDTALYSFLLFCGYLKAEDCFTIERQDHYRLKIPNIEVKMIFENMIVQWLNESYQDNDKLRKMLQALVNGNVMVFEELLNDFVLTTMSYFNTGGKNDVEKVYQAFILGLLVNLSADYDVTSEKESGFGRYDISVVPKDKKQKAIIMELKKINSSETKDKAISNALLQINEKKYDTAIIAQGVNQIDKIAVVFDGKKVWCKKE